MYHFGHVLQDTDQVRGESTALKHTMLPLISEQAEYGRFVRSRNDPNNNAFTIG
jgi:hypothetical protein